MLCSCCKDEEEGGWVPKAVTKISARLVEGDACMCVRSLLLPFAVVVVADVKEVAVGIRPMGACDKEDLLDEGDAAVAVAVPFATFTAPLPTPVVLIFLPPIARPPCNASGATSL